MLSFIKGILGLGMLAALACQANEPNKGLFGDLSAQIVHISKLSNKEQAVLQLTQLFSQSNLEVKQQIEIYNALVAIYRETSDLKRGIEALNHVVQLCARHHLLMEEATAQKQLGVMLYLSGENAKALIAYQRALSIFDVKERPLMVAGLHNNIGLVRAALGQSKQAMESYHQAKALYNEFGSARDRIDIYFNIAGLYSRLQRFDVAIEMLQKVIEERQAIDDQHGVAMAYGDLGIAYFNASNYLQAKYYYNKSLVYFQRTNQPYFIASQSHNISEVYNRLGQTKLAQSYAQQAITLGQQSSNKYAYIGGLHTLAKAQFQQKKFDQALESVSLALALAKKNNMQERARKYLSLKALIQAAMYRIEDALKTHKRYVELSNQEKNRQLEQQFVQYQIQQKSKELRQEIIELAQRKDIQMLKVKTIHQRRNMLLTSVLLMLLLGFLIYRRRVEAKLTTKLELQVAQRTKELKSLTEDLQRANEVKSQFMANMSHEIKTPLTSIIGHAEAIVRGEVTLNDLNKEINIILGNSTHVLSVLNDILDLSRIEVSKLEMCYEAHDIHVIVDEVSQLFCEQVKKKGLRFHVYHNLTMPLLINVDRIRLKQIIINLCSNAIKFTHSGEVVIHLAQQDKSLLCRVTDTGIGIEESQLSEIFHSFTQADNSISRRFGGSGLGLCLSQQLAVMMGGNITVKSALNKGSEFTLSLPCICSKLLIESPTRADDATNVSLNGRVLLAEDHDDNRALIARLLTSLGLSVIEASDGHQAIERGINEQPDLVLMDIQMPEVDGIDAFKTLRKQGYTKPIIALTANAMPDEVDHYLDIGFDDYLEKPIQRSSFVNTVAYYLNQTAPSSESGNQSFDDIDMSDLVDDFVSSLRAEHDKLFEFHESKDYDGIAKLTHRISGAASLFGFVTLATLSKEIQQKVKRNELDDIDNSIMMLLAMLRRTSAVHR